MTVSRDRLRLGRRELLVGTALLTTTMALTGCEAGAQPAVTFTNALKIPPLAPSELAADGVRVFRLELLADGRSEFLPGVVTRTWGINGSYLGPTVRATQGDDVRMEVVNRLDEETTLHWHGMRLPARMDGGPHQMIKPGQTWTPAWTIDQPATTTWFHPHLHEKTAMHVYRGLAGMFVIDPSDEAGLPGDYGIDDIPFIVQDKRFNDDGSLNDSRVDEGTYGMLGDEILVNGTHAPFLQVRTTRVRFRILNASNARVYRWGFADERTFQVVGTDGGALPSSVAVQRVKVSPGERVDVVVQIAPGEQVIIDSVGETGEIANDIEEGDFQLLQIRADPELSDSPVPPSDLGGRRLTSPGSGVRVRTFTLTGSEINGQDMDLTRIDEVVPAGAREVWEIRNTTFAHNFHIHEVDFRVLDINGSPVPDYQQGPKDTVFIPKEASARLAVNFGSFVDPVSPYMYHCHLLRHEDKGMMGQFVVVEPGTEESTARSIPAEGQAMGGPGHSGHPS